LNGGAEINGVIDTLAADAPMTAIAASRLGLNVALIANPLGMDDQGKSISKNLEENKVSNSINLLPDIKTPFIVVLSDEGGNREWFAYTKEAEKELVKADLAQIDNSTLVYIDLYSGIQEASLRAIDYATEKGVPIFLNMSGNIPSPELIARLKEKNNAITQIGLHESQESEAEKIATQIYETFDPKVSIVTLASKGALAVSGKTVVKTQAYSVDVVHVHGAGAVFSAGFAFGYLQNLGLQQNLEFACAIGSLSCTKERGFEQFTLEEIHQLKDRKNK
jgi:sugar/nucleoside kinase (ribokinase family)